VRKPAVLSEDDVKAMLINPFYAAVIDPDLAVAHEPMIPKKTWIAANEQLIKEIGPQEWLHLLLSVLEGDYPQGSNGPTAVDGYVRES
jgi:hypothetical protein